MIPVDHAHLNITAASHPGLRGKLNEDRYYVSAYRFSFDDRTPTVLAILADGIGGHRAGEVAAELAIKAIHQYILLNPSDQPADVLDQAFRHASQVILTRSKDDPLLVGMGTTCVCAWVIGDRLYAASVGDSRLYLQRGTRLIRLTTDHTWIQEALAQGTLTAEQARGHPNAHIIRRFLGSMNPLEPDLRLRLNSAESDTQSEANQGLLLLPGDRLVLCSDGLTDLVKDGEILEILQSALFELSPDQLIELANQRGGHDNITVVAMEVPPPPDITRPLPAKLPSRVAHTRKPRWSAVRWLMIALLLVAILLMVLLIVYFLKY